MSKVLILANYDVGLYQFRRELIQELLNDNEVYISLPNGDLVQPLIDYGCKFINTAVDRRGIKPATDIKLFTNYIHIIKKTNPDLVVTYTIKPNIYGGLACRLLRVPYAVNITGLGTAFEKKGALRKLVVRLYQSALKKVKVVFFENSENRKLFVTEHIVSEDKTCILNGAGVNLEHYRVREYPNDDKEFRFLFMGRVMAEKGINELFEAMRKLRTDGVRCVLYVLGGFEENYKAKIEKYEAEGWLRYQGYQTDVRPFVENCHCFVLPSWHEGMANTNLECAATGRPVITSNIPGCKEAVDDGITGFLVEPQNVDSLYKAMKKMTEESSANRMKMGLAGRTRMEKYFDKVVVVKKTLDELR